MKLATLRQIIREEIQRSLTEAAATPDGELKYGKGAKQKYRKCEKCGKGWAPLGHTLCPSCLAYALRNNESVKPRKALREGSERLHRVL